MKEKNISRFYRSQEKFGEAVNTVRWKPYTEFNAFREQETDYRTHRTGSRWKSHTNLTHPGKYFRPSKVKIMRPTSPK